MPIRSRKRNILSTLTATITCGGGGSCKRQRLSAVLEPQPRRQDSSSTSSTTALSSEAVEMQQGFGGSVAVEKDSEDPYLDFRQSMVQMIQEREIYSREELRELLDCFLQLNSAYYHGTIVRAFTEIWNWMFAMPTSTPRSRDLDGMWAS